MAQKGQNRVSLDMVYRPAPSLMTRQASRRPHLLAIYYVVGGSGGCADGSV